METTLIATAREFAKRAHKGQYRKDGKDYISHPLAVADILIEENLYGASSLLEFYSKEAKGHHHRRFVRDAVIVAYLHDTIEDTAVTEAALETEFDSVIASAVSILSRKQDQSYFDFISSMVYWDGGTFFDVVRQQPIILYCITLAIVVKLADLEHNMSDLQPGSMKDKYMFAKHYLLSELEELEKKRKDSYTA